MVDKTFCDTCGAEVAPTDKKTLAINHYHEEHPPTENQEKDTQTPTNYDDKTYTLCPQCLKAVEDYIDKYVKPRLAINKKKQMINDLMTTINKKIDLMEKLE